MSGDVQPRKRKDKKRKKDETAELPTHATSDDLNIHVHKEGGTGGGICAKVVFFILFSALAVLIGFIITEHRGSNDLETAEESRFSQLFEGWIDSAASHDHDEEHLVESPEEDESEIQDQEPLEEESEEGNDTEEQDDEDQNIESEEIEQDDEEPPESEEEDIPEPASEEQPEELEEEDEDEKEPEIEESGNSGSTPRQIPDESDSDNPSDDYEYENITNNDDWQIKEQIDEAQKTIQNE